jgi:hypothetical protein
MKKTDWNRIVNFAEWLTVYGIHYSNNTNFIEQRMAVVFLDQSMELMMKAFLIKEGYKIQYFVKSDIEEGLKESDAIGKEMMIDYIKVLNLIKKKIKKMQKIDQKAIKHFHEIRNKIYHGAAVNLQENKRNAMKDFIPKLKEFYTLAFDDRSFEANVIDKVPEIRNRMFQQISND